METSGFGTSRRDFCRANDASGALLHVDGSKGHSYPRSTVRWLTQSRLIPYGPYRIDDHLRLAEMNHMSTSFRDHV
jgi:hypothetical protein